LAGGDNPDQFADGDDFGMLDHFAQGGAEIGRRFQGIGRMPADGGVNGREFSARRMARSLLSRVVPMEIILLMPAACARAMTSAKSPA